MKKPFVLMKDIETSNPFHNNKIFKCTTSEIHTIYWWKWNSKIINHNKLLLQHFFNDFKTLHISDKWQEKLLKWRKMKHHKHFSQNSWKIHKQRGRNIENLWPIELIVCVEILNFFKHTIETCCLFLCWWWMHWWIVEDLEKRVFCVETSIWLQTSLVPSSKIRCYVASHQLHLLITLVLIFILDFVFQLLSKTQNNNNNNNDELLSLFKVTSHFLIFKIWNIKNTLTQRKRSDWNLYSLSLFLKFECWKFLIFVCLFVWLVGLLFVNRNKTWNTCLGKWSWRPTWTLSLFFYWLIDWLIDWFVLFLCWIWWRKFLKCLF
jgi:hypothetical protein